METDRVLSIDVSFFLSLSFFLLMFISCSVSRFSKIRPKDFKRSENREFSIFSDIIPSSIEHARFVHRIFHLYFAIFDERYERFQDPKILRIELLVARKRRGYARNERLFEDDEGCWREGL